MDKYQGREEQRQATQQYFSKLLRELGLSSKENTTLQDLRCLNGQNSESGKSSFGILQRFFRDISSNHNNAVVNLSNNTSIQDKPVNSRDMLFTILNSCDPFLLQEVQKKIFESGNSVTLLLPNSDGSKLDVLLWGLRRCSSIGFEVTKGTVQYTNVTKDEFPVVSMVRIGELSISKSVILNNFLAKLQTKQNHVYFLDHTNDPSEKIWFKGSVEAFWYTPLDDSQGNEKIGRFCLLNLRGNGMHFTKQVEICKELSQIMFLALNDQDIVVHSEFILEIARVTKVILLVHAKEREGKIGQNISKEIEDVIFIRNQSLSETTEEMSKKLIVALNKSVLDFPPKMKPLGDFEGRLKELGIGNVELLPRSQSAKGMATEICKKISQNSQNKKTYFALHSLWKTMHENAEEQTRLKQPPNLPTISELMSTFALGTDVGLYFFRWLEMLLSEQFEREFIANGCVQNVRDMSYKQRYDLFKSYFEDNCIDINHFLQEMGQIQEWPDASKQMNLKFNYARKVADIIISGQSFQICDGDVCQIKASYIANVFNELRRKTKEAKSVKVVSILGGKGSGKSKLLNMLFSVNFPDGKAMFSKGIMCYLLPVRKDAYEQFQCEYVLVVDTEGLHTGNENSPSAYRKSHYHTVLACFISDVLILNIGTHEKSEQIVILYDFLVRCISTMKKNMALSKIIVAKHFLKEEYFPKGLYARNVARAINELIKTKGLKDESNTQLYTKVLQLMKRGSSTDAEYLSVEYVPCRKLSHLSYFETSICSFETKHHFEFIQTIIGKDSTTSQTFKSLGERLQEASSSLISKIFCLTNSEISYTSLSSHILDILKEDYISDEKANRVKSKAVLKEIPGEKVTGLKKINSDKSNQVRISKKSSEPIFINSTQNQRLKEEVENIIEEIESLLTEEGTFDSQKVEKTLQQHFTQLEEKYPLPKFNEVKLNVEIRIKSLLRSYGYTDVSISDYAFSAGVKVKKGMVKEIRERFVVVDRENEKALTDLKLKLDKLAKDYPNFQNTSQSAMSEIVIFGRRFNYIVDKITSYVFLSSHFIYTTHQWHVEAEIKTTASELHSEGLEYKHASNRGHTELLDFNTITSKIEWCLKEALYKYCTESDALALTKHLTEKEIRKYSSLPCNFMTLQRIDRYFIQQLPELAPAELRKASNTVDAAKIHILGKLSSARSFKIEDDLEKICHSSVSEVKHPVTKAAVLKHVLSWGVNAITGKEFDDQMEQNVAKQARKNSSKITALLKSKHKQNCDSELAKSFVQIIRTPLKLTVENSVLTTYMEFLEMSKRKLQKSYFISMLKTFCDTTENMHMLMKFIQNYDALDINIRLGFLAKLMSREQMLTISEIYDMTLDKEITQYWEGGLEVVRKTQDESKKQFRSTFLRKIRSLIESYSTCHLDEQIIDIMDKVENHVDFTRSFIDSLKNLKSDLKKGTYMPASKDENDWKTWSLSLPDELYLKYLGIIEGCTKQCPTCGKLCDKSDEHKLHSADMHIPVGIKGSQEPGSPYLSSKICTDLLARNENFLFSPSKKIEPFSKFLMRVGADWEITGEPACVSSSFWKYVFSEYNEHLAGYYGCRKGGIPEDWATYSKTAAFASLEEMKK